MRGRTYKNVISDSYLNVLFSFPAYCQLINLIIQQIQTEPLS